MFQKFSKKKSVQKSGSPKSRALRLENLENRELLSVTTFEAETAVAFESQTFAPAPNAEAIDLATLAQGAATETPSLLVTTATDVVDATDGEISLREAIAYSEADATLGGVVTFAASLKGATITLGGSQLEITQSVAIDASALWDATNDAPGLTIDANAKSRIFGVSGGTEAAPVELVALALINGLAADGGAVNASGVVAFENCSIKNNVSSERGGGVYAYKATTIINGLIAENRTDASGGGVMLRGEATLVNATIAGNEAAVSGGGLYGYNSSASATLSNAIVVDNVATTVVAGADYNVYPNFSTLNAYNVLSTFSAWTNKTEEDVVHYIYDATQPLFTDAENGDYSLAENSQALDKGADALAVDAQGDALTLDLAGKPRFNGTVDVGAYEKPAVPNAPTNLTLSQNKLASAEGTYLLLKWADVASTTFTLNLTAPENATKMRVEVSTEPFATEATIPGADLTRCATLNADAQTWTPKKLTPGATYYVRVRAINAAGVSDWSEVLELTTPTETLKTSNAVSEAFAELFADDVEDDFWFELESTLGKRK